MNDRHCFHSVSVTLSKVYCATYRRWFGAAGPTTSNDCSSKNNTGEESIEDHHGNETGLDHFDVAAVVHCVEIKTNEYS